MTHLKTLLFKLGQHPRSKRSFLSAAGEDSRPGLGLRRAALFLCFPSKNCWGRTDSLISLTLFTQAVCPPGVKVGRLRPGLKITRGPGEAPSPPRLPAPELVLLTVGHPPPPDRSLWDAREGAVPPPALPRVLIIRCQGAARSRCQRSPEDSPSSSRGSGFEGPPLARPRSPAALLRGSSQVATPLEN